MMPKTQPPQAARRRPADPLETTATLADEIVLQRQVNERLLALWDRLERDDPAGETPGQQVKVAAALTAGTGRVARLLRDQRALSGEAADGLTGAIAQVLDELSTEMGVAL